MQNQKIKIRSKTKWLDRRRNVEDIRKFIFVDGKILKSSRSVNSFVVKPSGGMKKQLKSLSRQQAIFSDMLKDVERPEELVQATVLSKGVRRKVEKNKENNSSEAVEISPKSNPLSVNQVDIPPPTVLPVVNRSASHCSFTDEPEQPAVTCDNSTSATGCSAQPMWYSDESASTQCYNNFSATTLQNILNCDTEKFL